MKRKSELGPVSLPENVKLCHACFTRQGFSKKLLTRIAVSPKDCELCRGSLAELAEVSEDIARRLGEYEFETFLVGSSLPQQVLDKEDELRSKYKIRGKESIKTQVTRTIGRKVSEILGKDVEYTRPEVTVLVSLQNSPSISIYSRSIWLKARYLKKRRGILQRSSTCRTCNGVGCVNCDYKGKSENSVQELVSKLFNDAFSAEGCNFIWVGSEDENSLVEGNGRPFFVEVLCPKRRKLSPRLFRARHGTIHSKRQLASKVFESNGIEIRDMEILLVKPSSIPPFRIRAKIYLKREPEGLAELHQQEMESNFSNTRVNVRLSRRFKTIVKQIQSLRVEPSEDGSRAILDISCDGGIPLKKLVTGADDAVSPNLSGFARGYIIDEAMPFDILEVEFLPEADASRKFRMGGKRGRRARHLGKVRDEPPLEADNEILLEN